VGTDRTPAPGAVGLIGLGEAGQVHAAAIRQSRAARLVAAPTARAGQQRVPRRRLTTAAEPAAAPDPAGPSPG